MGVSAFHRAYWDGRAYRRTKIYQQDHIFQFGDVVRIDKSTGQWILACADTLENAEGLAVVSHSGYRGEDGTASTADYARRALPSYAFDHRTQTDQECNDPRHFFSVVFRGEITVPDAQDIDYSQHALLAGTDSTPEAYTPGGVYYLSPFPTEQGKLIRKSPQEFGGKIISSVVKPMLIALDHTRAVVVNYIGHKLDSLPDEWINIQDVQKVGAIGAFLETSIPASWIACDGRLCTSAQYPALAETIGGSVRVHASLTLEADPPQADIFTGVDGYCVLDFSEEDIDVSAALIGQPLNIKLESSSSASERSAIIDGIIDSNRLRVIVDTDAPLDGTSAFVVGQSIDVKVRAPYAPGIDQLFFVPNLRDRTVKGADPLVVFAGSNTQYDTGDYSGNNQVVLDVGNDIQTGSDYSATVDNRADAIKVVFAIKTATVDCGSFINECCAPVTPVGLNDNAIINGAFLVWQRGKEFSRNTIDAQPQYTADRWFEDFSISYPARPPSVGQYHVLKKGVKKSHYNPASIPPPVDPGDIIAPGAYAIDLPDDITTYAQFQGTLMTADNSVSPTTYAVSSTLLADRESYHYLENRIEDVRTLSNQRATLSFWARGTQSGSIFVSLRQHFAGTRGILDDAYSRPIEIMLDGTANWNRYEIVFDIPDVQETKPSDSFIGANNFLGAQFWTMYFAGNCTGTPNPTVYDTVVATPGPNSEGVPLAAVAPCPPDCIEWTAIRWYPYCAGDMCDTCPPQAGGADLCGVGASSITCCTSVKVEIGDTVCVGEGCGSLGCPSFQQQLPPERCGAVRYGWVTANCIPQAGIFACTTAGEAPPNGLPGLCAVAQISGCVPEGFSGHPNAYCMGINGASPAESSLVKCGGCGCSGDCTSTDTTEELADRLCACCACKEPSEDKRWGCQGGIQPTASPVPPSPSATDPPASPSNSPAPSPDASPAPSPPASPAPSPPASPVATPSITPTRTPTPTPTRTVTPTVTPTSTPNPTPTPSPMTPTPSPTRPTDYECVAGCCLPVMFESDFNYDGVVHLTGVQLIRGVISSEFQETDYLDELKKCQRYYETDDNFVIGGLSKQSSGGSYFDSVNYMVQKRKTKAPCVDIHGYFEPDLVTGCTLDTVEVDCYNDESAVIRLEATPVQASLGLCAAVVQYVVDADLYESPCPDDPYRGTTVTCPWEEVS
jgi:hypothetical protein